MKINLNVRCTYSVECEFDNVPDEVAGSLINLEDVREGTEVYDWLSDNIRECDAMDWEFDVLNAEEIKEE